MLKKHKADALADKLEKDVEAVFEWVPESEAYRRIGFVTRPLSKRAAKMLRKTAALETERNLLIEVCDDWQAMFRQQTKYGEELLCHANNLIDVLKRVDQFITNGILLGFIRMPDDNTYDPAHEVPKLVRSAIANSRATTTPPPRDGFTQQPG